MKHGVRESDALDRLVEEARAEGVPDADWEAVERSLMRRVASEPRAVAPEAPSRPTWVWLGAALAGVAAGLWLFSLREEHAADREQAREKAPATAGIDGKRLSVGSVVEARTDPVTVEHAGHATWILDPGSRAHLESAGDVITVALERGSLFAHVVKVPRAESFVVLAARTRVAVHGTKFRVTRAGSEVRVQVDEGVLGIGPVGGSGFELPAPGSAVLTLDGVRTDGTKGPPEVASGQAPPPSPETARAPGPPRAGTAEHREARTAGDGAARGTSTATRAAADPGPSAERAMAVVKACFRSHTVAQGDLSISATTTMSLHVLPDGTVVEARFEPPLAPSVQQCAEGELSRIRFPESGKGLSLRRSIELDR